MHVRELVELAALVSGQAEVMVADGTQLTRDGLSEYWSASKDRLDRWSRSLEHVTGGVPDADPAEFAFVPAVVEPLLHEVFAADVLTRVWAAVVAVFDQTCSQNAATAVARSIVLSHEEVRCRALQWILDGLHSGGSEADAVNLVRRRCDRWTDLLVANLYHLGDVAEFARDPSRAQEFAHDIAEERRNGTHPAAWALTMSSLRASLHVGIARESCSREANRRIGGAVLACLGPDLFTSTGSLRTAWLARLQRVAVDAECLLRDLLAVEGPPSDSWQRG